MDEAMPDDSDDVTTGRRSGVPASSRARSDAEIVESLAPRVRRIAGSLLRNDHDADDASQVALLELVRALPTYRGEGTIEAFCDRVVVRTSIRIARARRLSSVRTDGGVEPDELPSAPPRADLAEGLPRTIEAYLHELPEARRTALVLRHAMGYSMDEIAALTEVSVNTVKSRLLEARDQVRRMVRRDVATGRRAP
ncbi:MAG: sigma-70 family RNA polymerase sigma factor [Myxococcales bacterium]|nr:sigma-70 family RNA polymerase sigma factor [Myxococcales bacterium]